MRLAMNLYGILRGSLATLGRFFAPIITWLSLGWAGRVLFSLFAASAGSHLVPALLLLVLSMVVWVICIVMAIRAATSDLASFDRVDDQPHVPEIRPLTRREVIDTAVIPFLVVYAAWGLTDEQVGAAFNMNMAFHGMDASNFSLTFAAWKLYLGIAIGAWLLLPLLRWVLTTWAGIVGTFALTFVRALAIISAFIGVGSALQHLRVWAESRVFWAWGEAVWFGFLDALPSWQLPFDVALPEAIRTLGRSIWTTITPGLLESVLFPMVWLALIAMVVGWHDFTRGIGHDRLSYAVSGGARRFRDSRVGSHLETAAAASPLGLLKWAIAEKLDDYLPAVQAWRLIVFSGGYFIGAYLILSAITRACSAWISHGLMWLIGSHTFQETMLYIYAVDYVADVSSMALSIGVYIFAFDKAMSHAVAHTLRVPHPN